MRRSGHDAELILHFVEDDTAAEGVAPLPTLFRALLPVLLKLCTQASSGPCSHLARHQRADDRLQQEFLPTLKLERRRAPVAALSGSYRGEIAERTAKLTHVRAKRSPHAGAGWSTGMLSSLQPQATAGSGCQMAHPGWL